MQGRILEDRYLIEGAIDAGGMGVVHRARDLRLDRTVAVKFAQPPDPTRGATLAVAVQEALIEEARIVSALEHPSIVPVYALGHDEAGCVFVVMKLVNGRTLAAWIEERAAASRATRSSVLPSGRQVEILQRIGEALAYAHARGVVHADLKPANVMIGEFGEVQVMDWGLSAALRRSGAAASSPQSVWSETAAGRIYGTPSYMAPEQAGGGGSIDARTDVFGLGAVGYHMATGNPPYDGASVEEVLARARAGNRNDPHGRSAVTPVDRDLLAILDKAMVADSRRRYPDVGALLADLVALRESRPLAARRDGPLRRLHKGVRRRPATATFVAAAAVLCTAGVWAFPKVLAGEEHRRQARLASLALSLERIEATEEVRSESVLRQQNTNGADTQFVDDAPTMQEQARQALRYAGRCGDLVDLLTQHAVDLSSEAAAAASCRLIRNGGDIELCRMLIRALDTLHRFLHMAGVDVAMRVPYPTEDGRLWVVRDQLPVALQSLGGGPLGVESMRAHRRWALSREFDASTLQPANDSSPEDLEFLSYVLSATGNHARATEVLHRAVAKAPAIAHLRKRFLTQLLKQASAAPDTDTRPLLELAIAQGHVAIALDPGSASAESNLGLAYEQLAKTPGVGTADAQRHLASAERHYEAVLERQPRHLPALVGMANVELRRDAPRKALKFLHPAQEVAPSDFSVWHLTGLAYDRIVETSFLFGPVQEAIEAFRKAAELRPEWWETHLRLGMALQSDAKHGEAIAAFRRGLELHPNGKDLRLFLADSLWATQKHHEAMTTLLDLLRDHPDHAAAKANYRHYEERLPTQALRTEFAGRVR